MIDSLKLIDKTILLAINSFHSSFLDVVMFYLSEIWIFTPFFIYLIYLIYKKIGIKKTSILIVFVAILITLCDQTATVTKKSVKRFRPTHNIEIKDNLLIVKNYRGGTYGFFSGHAANTFGIAMFLFLLFSKQTKASRFVFFIWAGLVSYSRMYLGVHYPSDIFVGMLVGLFFGFVVYQLQKLYFLKTYDESISI
jgi:undecaprenyl-diphosphatase